MDKITIIIVNWNTGHYLADCIQSLVNLPQQEKELIDEIIIVDNASRDKSIIKAKDIVGRNFNKPRVRFILNNRNFGFAAANNLGLKRVMAKENDDHVLLLNPDTKVAPAMLTQLRQVLIADATVGIVGPKLIDGNGKLQLSVRPFPTARDMILYLLKLGHLVRPNKINYNHPQAVDQVMGASFLIRNKLLTTVGQLDQQFFVWFEEVDYCRRAKAAGWKVWYTPAAQCVHYGAVSFDQLVGFKKTIPWLKSTLHYARKYMSPATVFTLYLLSVVNLVLSIPATFTHLTKRALKKSSVISK